MIRVSQPLATWMSISNNYGDLSNGRSFTSQNSLADWCREGSGQYPLLRRFEVRAGDHWAQDVIDDGGTTTRERSEVSDASPALPFNTDIWVAYDFLIKAGPDSTAPYLILGQFHSQPDSGSDKAVSPPWAIELDGTNLTLSVRTTPILISPGNPAPTIYSLANPVKRGVWYRAVCRVNFDWNVGGTSLLQFWLNGVKVVDSVAPIGYNDALGPYFKYGVYRGQSPETFVAIYNDVQISQNSLAARINSNFSLPLDYLL